MQRIQNKSIKDTYGRIEGNENKTIAQLHDSYDIEPINISIWNQAHKAWNRLNLVNPDIVERSNNASENPY